MLRLLTALFEDTARDGLTGGRSPGPIWCQTGVPKGFVLSPLLFVLMFSPVTDALQETGADVSVNGFWAGAFLLMDDVALVVDSHARLRTLTVALWRMVLEQQIGALPGAPRDFRGCSWVWGRKRGDCALEVFTNVRDERAQSGAPR